MRSLVCHKYVAVFILVLRRSDSVFALHALLPRPRGTVAASGEGSHVVKQAHGRSDAFVGSTRCAIPWVSVARMRPRQGEFASGDIGLA